MHVQSYLFFDGRCEEAIQFYKKAVGAEVKMMMRFKDSPEPPREGCAPTDPNKVMHASLGIGDSDVIASDGMAQGKPNFQGFALSLTCANEAEADKRFAALSDGGQVHQPLTKTFFSPRFGMLVDKFGVMWMLMVLPKS